jgi:hypothetical protein
VFIHLCGYRLERLNINALTENIKEFCLGHKASACRKDTPGWLSIEIGMCDCFVPQRDDFMMKLTLGFSEDLIGAYS